ncbi:MAG: helix-turn-helix transcriptional regulator [Pseudomonadales bacterium]
MEDFLTEQEVADLFRLLPTTLRQWRFNKKGPTYYKLGGAIRYRESELIDFINSSRIEGNQQQ